VISEENILLTLLVCLREVCIRDW